MKDNKNKRDNKQEGVDELKIYGAPGSTLQTPEENRHDQGVDPRKDNTIDVSNDDLRKTDIDRMQENLEGKRGDTEIDDTLSNEV